MAAVQPLGPHNAPNAPPAPLVAKPPTPGEPARREFAPTAADVADAGAALERMEAELAATPTEASVLLAYASRRDAAREARGAQRPATMLRHVATVRPSLGDPAPDPVWPLLLAPSDPVEKPPRKRRKTRKKAASGDNRIYGIDKAGKPNPNVGQAWGKSADPVKYIECREGTPNNPGPAVPGAKEWPAEAVPTECLGYPDYKKKRGTNMFRKGKKNRFYNANGYYKIAVNNGHHANSSKAVFKFFKAVKRARA